VGVADLKRRHRGVESGGMQLFKGMQRPSLEMMLQPAAAAASPAPRQASCGDGGPDPFNRDPEGRDLPHGGDRDPSEPAPQRGPV